MPVASIDVPEDGLPDVASRKLDRIGATEAAVLEPTVSTSVTCGPLWPGPTRTSSVSPGRTVAMCSESARFREGRHRRTHRILDHENYVVGSFGDTSEMATERADLVIAGTKRVTASFALRASLTASPPSEIARLRYRLAIRTIIT